MSLSGPFLFRVDLSDTIIHATGSGLCNQYGSVVELTRAVHQQVISTHTKRVLVDFQEVDLKLQWSDIYNLVKLYEGSMPEFYTIMVGGVFNSSGLEFANYWRDIGIARGFTIQNFPNTKEAETWL
jgi:hypothetical protein